MGGGYVKSVYKYYGDSSSLENSYNETSKFVMISFDSVLDLHFLPNFKPEDRCREETFVTTTSNTLHSLVIHLERLDIMAATASSSKVLPDMMTSIRITADGEVEMVDQLLLPCVSYPTSLRGDFADQTRAGVNSLLMFTATLFSGRRCRPRPRLSMLSRP
jgi:hypothetical protein